MLLGKRSRNPMKRTTSMTGLTVDVSNNVVEDVREEPIMSFDDHPAPFQNQPLHEFQNDNFVYGQRLLALVSPRVPASGGRSGYPGYETAPFLRSCCLCKRRLAPARDIYMYRGDTAFCSLECREQQMKQDERKAKLQAIAAKKEGRHSSSATTTAATATATADASTKTEPVAAA